MKIYIVVANYADMYEDYCIEWNDAVFISEKAADEYIQRQPNRFDKDYRRIKELEDLIDTRALTEDELNEFQKLNFRWRGCRYCPIYRIEEHEVRE